jgi:hypothetical protein
MHEFFDEWITIGFDVASQYCRNQAEIFVKVAASDGILTSNESYR